MTTIDTTYLILFSANLAFIVTHLYGWLLKWYYKPEAYREHFHELFPAQRSVGIIYLLQVLEIPYLLQIGDPDALLYVNAFSLLFFSIQMLIMCEGYFFPERKHGFKEHWIFLPAVLVLAPMLLQAVKVISLPDGWRVWAVGAVSIIFLAYFWLSVREALKIRNAVQRANEEKYADSDDFPVRFANLIRWVPTLVLILLAINFYADNVWVKFGRDILFIGANVWFCVLTLNPWRKVVNQEILGGSERPEVPETSESTEIQEYLEKDGRYDDLMQHLERLLMEDMVFTETHITSDVLISKLGTNSKYLAEVIRRSGYQSFYDMISQHRVRYAISLIHQYPEKRLADIAVQCGFTSQASMTKAFKAQGKESPSNYRS